MEEKLLVAIQDAAITIATPNWSSVVSVFLSLLAIVVAGFVAWRQNKIVLKQAEISEQQNKIALFEKRYEVYKAIDIIITVAKEIREEIENKDQADEVHRMICERWNTSSNKGKDDKTKPSSCTQDISSILRQSEFLFSQDIYKAIKKLDRAHIVLYVRFSLNYNTCLGFSIKEINSAKEDFCASVDDFLDKKIIECIKMDLQLQSIKL